MTSKATIGLFGPLDDLKEYLHNYRATPAERKKEADSELRRDRLHLSDKEAWAKYGGRFK
jgi:hypothetical protein